jgi:hypothetical protein
MQEGTATRRARRPERDGAERLRQMVDERDETIRLLNEALSRALEELERVQPRRAA